MLSFDALSLDSIMLDEARAYLRIDPDIEETSLGAIMLAAVSHAEQFTGQILLRRQIKQTLTAGSGWQRLSVTPVVRIISVEGVPAEGAIFALENTAYQATIDCNNDAFFRVRRAGAAGRIAVTIDAGIAENWSELPEALRLAILRLTGHFYANRDGGDDAGPPAAIAALLRPWRRMRLTSGAIQ
jgi:uncharacterized phiE125 gp8 family phage protein